MRSHNRFDSPISSSSISSTCVICWRETYITNPRECAKAIPCLWPATQVTVSCGQLLVLSIPRWNSQKQLILNLVVPNWLLKFQDGSIVIRPHLWRAVALFMSFPCWFATLSCKAILCHGVWIGKGSHFHNFSTWSAQAWVIRWYFSPSAY